MSQLVLWKQTYRRGWSIPCRYLSKLMKGRSSFSSFFVRGTLNIKTGKQQCLTSYRVHTCFPSKWKVGQCHQVEIFEDHLTYLGLFWKDSSNRAKFYAFTVLPFGYRPPLTCSPKFLSLSRNIEDTLGHLHCCFSWQRMGYWKGFSSVQFFTSGCS